MGAWVSYGLGSEADDLPAFTVLISHGSGKDANQGLLERLWGAGFLPSSYQGVKLRSSGDSVLYLANPPGIDRNFRRKMLDGLARLNQQQLASSGDPEIAARIAQYEMAFRMQQSVPDLTDLSSESASTFELYGEQSKMPGTFVSKVSDTRGMSTPRSSVPITRLIASKGQTSLQAPWPMQSVGHGLIAVTPQG